MQNTDIGFVRPFFVKFGLQCISKLVQPGKNSCSAYENMMERGKLVWVDQNARYFGQQGLQTIQDLDILGTKGFVFLCTLLGILRQGISGLVSLALTIIDLEVVTREFLGPSDLSKAQTLCFHESAKVVIIGKYKYLILRPL